MIVKFTNEDSGGEICSFKTDDIARIIQASEQDEIFYFNSEWYKFSGISFAHNIEDGSVQEKLMVYLKPYEIEK